MGATKSLLEYTWWSHNILTYHTFLTTKHHLPLIHSSEQLWKAFSYPPRGDENAFHSSKTWVISWFRQPWPPHHTNRSAAIHAESLFARPFWHCWLQMSFSAIWLHESLKWGWELPVSPLTLFIWYHAGSVVDSTWARQGRHYIAGLQSSFQHRALYN